MLVQALNSSPNITCFGELFNWQMDFVGFNVPGYDNFDGQDNALRDRDFEAFLRERVYCQHDQETQAVGFKLLFAHVSGFPRLAERLAGDTEIRVLHLRRRNLLRALLSSTIAQTTGVWVEDRRLTLANVRTAVRHPLRVAARLRRPLLRPKASRVKTALSAEQCRKFFKKMQWNADVLDELFREHQKFTLFYEDLLEHREEVLGQAQAFLGVEPTRLTVTMRRQNPEPLPELLENYDELYTAFRSTPHAWMFR